MYVPDGSLADVFEWEGEGDAGGMQQLLPHPIYAGEQSKEIAIYSIISLKFEFWAKESTACSGSSEDQS